MANAYIEKVNKARKSGAKSFMHNDNVYVRSETKTGLVVFKKK